MTWGLILRPAPHSHISGKQGTEQYGRYSPAEASPSLDAVQAAGSLADIETAGSEALAATRRVVGLLRDAAPAAEGHERLGELIERFESHGRRAHLRLDAEPSRWPPEVSSTVYRIVRESRHHPHRPTPMMPPVPVRE